MDSRAAVEEESDHRFAGGEHGGDEFTLPADQIEIGAVAHVLERPRFARGLFVATDGEHDDVGLLRDFDGFGNLSAVFGRIAGNDFVLLPRAADGDFATFGVEHFDVLADLLTDAFEHGDVEFGSAAVAAEQRAVGIWPDDRDGFQLGRSRAGARLFSFLSSVMVSRAAWSASFAVVVAADDALGFFGINIRDRRTSPS